MASTPPLIRLARHILSITVNSASCERLFSTLGNTLTKLRNRLSTQTLVSLAELKMHIRDEYLEEGKSMSKALFWVLKSRRQLHSNHRWPH